MREKGAIVLEDRGRHRRSAGRLGRRIRWTLILFLVTGCVAFSVDAMEERTRIRQARVDISRIGHAARLFRADFGRCPRGIDELRDPPRGEPYLGIDGDPWGRPYRLSCPARLDPGGVDVSSGGPDRSFMGDDNISSL
jgi:hypothetical protein